MSDAVHKNSDYIIFVDESGDHSLTKIDPEYPVFVLSFCIFKRAAYAGPITEAIRLLKFDMFGHDMVILHESDIRRKRGAFSQLGKEARESFMDRLTAIIDSAAMTMIAVVIHKTKLATRYNKPEHPYHLAMKFGLERIYRLLSEARQAETTTYVVCEARGAKEDAELELAFRRVADGANMYARALPLSLVIADKKANSEGLQLADLTARPIGLSVLRPDQPNRAWECLTPKVFCNYRGEIQGVGLKIFP